MLLEGPLLPKLLEEAVALARAHPHAEHLIASLVALGDARRRTGHPRQALTLYERAAAALERSNRRLGSDQLRTGFRSTQLAPYDAALDILLFGGAPDAAAALRWSARRKGAALFAAGMAGRVPADLSLVLLQSRLGTDEAVVDYSIADSAVAAIVVRRHTAAIVRLPERVGRITDWIMAARPAPVAPGARLDLAHSGYDSAAAAALHQALVAPLARHLEGVRVLTVIPDGVLWYVAFAALAAGPGEYLIDRYQLRVAPSAQFLTRRSAGALPPGFRVTAMMLDVPGGVAELAGMRGALGPERVRVRSGTAATEAAALGAATDVLHVAAHSMIDDRDPLATHLQLAAHGRDDGLLHLPEIAARTIGPRLVVLAACQAASGRLYRGEGLVGLARAFLLGGARNVVASSWPVLETSSELMGAFYESLAEGVSAAAALRAAQVRLRSRPATAHPLHWGGYVVIGW